MKAPFLVPPFSLSLCVPLHCNTIHANLKYHFACFMALPSGRGWGWPWGVPSPAPVAGRFFWMAKCLWRGESGSWQCWAVQVNLSHGSRGRFWILRLTDSLSPFILHPRSSLENLERCPSSLESGVFYCSFLAIWGLILDTAFCSLTPKLNPNSCTDLLYLYVDFDSSVSWVNCCLTSEWQWAWVFLSFGVGGGGKWSWNSYSVHWEAPQVANSHHYQPPIGKYPRSYLPGLEGWGRFQEVTSNTEQNSAANSAPSQTILKRALLCL